MRLLWRVAGGSLAVAISSTCYAEASFDLAKFNSAPHKPVKSYATDREPIIVSAVRPDLPKTRKSSDDRKRIAAIEAEAGVLVLSAIDAGMTINCLNRNECVEMNPLLGRHPSAAKLLLLKAGMGALHLVAFKAALDESPSSALRLAQISCIIQGSALRMNARMSFK